MAFFPGILGYQAKIYIPVATVDTEVKIVGKVSVPKKHSEVESTSREDGGKKTWCPGLTEYGATFFLQKRKGHPCYSAIQTGFRTKAPIVFTFADGDIETIGTDLVVMTACVFDFSEEQELDGIVGHNVTVKPTWSETPPAESTVAS